MSTSDSRLEASLLHNMSAQPRTALVHETSDRFLVGRRLIVALPASAGAIADEVLTQLFGTATEAEVRHRLDEHARALPLPAAVAVVANACDSDSVCDDPLTAAAVLSKASSTVYLRDKEPNLSAIRPGRRVVLLLPPERPT